MEWIWLFVSLGAMLLGADWLVRGCTSLARRIGVSEFIVSAIIIGIGTSVPELMVAILSGARDMGALVLTNTVSSNVINILWILGIGALICPVVLVGRRYLTDMIFMFVAGIVLTVMLFFGPIGFVDGLILLGIFVAYVAYSWQNQSQTRTVPTDESLWKILPVVVGGILTVCLSSEFFMDMLGLIIANYGISQTMAGVLIVAPGTSLPELLVTIIAAVQRRPLVAIGNIIGSNFVNIVLIVAVGAIISDLPVTRHIMQFDIWMMLLAFGLLCFDLLYRRGLTRGTGVLYLALAAAYFYLAILIN